MKMDRVALDEASLQFLNDWVVENGYPLGVPPVSLRGYELYVNDRMFYRASSPDDCANAQLRVFSGVAKYAGTKRENLGICFFDDGHVEEYNDSGGGIIESPNVKLDDDDGYNQLRIIIWMHLTLMHFLASFKPELIEYSEKHIEHAKSKPNGKIRKNTYTRIALYRYINDLKSGKKRLPHRKCEYRFGVRGHYRHYKNGSVRFIAAYEKNKGKPERKSTVYKLPT